MKFTFILVLPLLILAGCCTVHKTATPARRFEFGKDTFSFTNGLLWVYEYDAKGNWTTHTRTPRPDYWQHCFVVARASKQFFINARFGSSLPKVNEATYRKLVKQVVHSSARCPSDSRVVFPGYANLHEFSLEHEQLLKRNCGGAWQSYFQRGHWHVVLPFTRRSQQITSKRLLDELARNE